MAVKTVFSSGEFSKILAEYDLGTYTDSEPFTAGAVQTNYLLRTTKGKFVFRYYENRTEGSVIFETNLIKYLTDRNFPCPTPFKNKHGRFVGTHKQKPFAIFEFVDGKQIEHPTEKQKKQLIQQVATLQRITKGYRPQHTGDRWNYGIPLCRKLAQESAQKINTANTREKLAWYEGELLKLQLPTSLPKGICHCDFHFSNVLYKDGEFKALIDFDDANYTYLIFDLATLINPFVQSFEWDTWQHFKNSDNVFDFTEARKVVAEYMNYRPLNFSEKRHLFDVFKLTVMIDCLWYFARGEAQDFYERRKIEYLDTLSREVFYRQLFS